MLKQQLQQKLQQKLSPQQIQIIRLLELTELELEERVKQELVENPALEEGGESLYPENESQDDGPQESAEELSLADYRSEDDIPDYRLEADNFSRKERREEIPFSGAGADHDDVSRHDQCRRQGIHGRRRAELQRSCRRDFRNQCCGWL